MIPPMTLQEWERDVRNRQRNIVFPDTVLNEGRFYRNIASGQAIFTPGQKISALAMIFWFLFISAGDVALALGMGKRDPEAIFVSFIWLLFWIVLAVKTLIPASPPPRKRRRGFR